MSSALRIRKFDPNQKTTRGSISFTLISSIVSEIIQKYHPCCGCGSFDFGKVKRTGILGSPEPIVYYQKRIRSFLGFAATVIHWYARKVAGGGCTSPSI